MTELDSSGRHVWPGSAHPTAVTVQESLADGPHDLFLQLPEVMTRHTPAIWANLGSLHFFEGTKIAPAKTVGCCFGKVILQQNGTRSWSATCTVGRGLINDDKCKTHIWAKNKHELTHMNL